MKTIRWNPDRLRIPHSTLVVIMGGSWPSTQRFLQRHFSNPAWQLTMADCQTLLGEHGHDFSIYPQAWTLLQACLESRLALGGFTAVCCPPLYPHQYRNLQTLAVKAGIPTVFIYLHPPLTGCLRENERAPYPLEEGLLHAQHAALADDLGTFATYRLEALPDTLVILNDPETIRNLQVDLVPIREAWRHLDGPFDVIGFVGGQYSRLEAMFHHLGYQKRLGQFVHPEGRLPVFLGELIGPGGDNLETLRLAWQMIESEQALYVLGDGLLALSRYFQGQPFSDSRPELQENLLALIEQLSQSASLDRQAVATCVMQLYRRAAQFLVLDGGRLIALNTVPRSQRFSWDTPWKRWLWMHRPSDELRKQLDYQHRWVRPAANPWIVYCQNEVNHKRRGRSVPLSQAASLASLPTQSPAGYPCISTFQYPEGRVITM